MKRFSMIQMVIVALLATRAWAGSLTVVGNQTVSNNLTAQSITLGDVTRTNWPTGPSGGVIDLTGTVVDFTQTGLLYRITLTDNASWVFTNHVAGRMVYLQITENGTGGWTNGWPAEILWPGGQVLSGSTSSNSVSVFRFLDNGTNWLAQTEGLNYSLPPTNNFALQFDGSQNYVNVPGSSALDPQGAFTIEFWTKGGSVQSTAMSNYGDWYIWRDTGGHFHFVLGFQNYGRPTIDSTVSVTDGNWHHLAVSYDNNIVRIFVGGTLDVSLTIGADNLTQTSSAFTIGSANDESDFMNGALDEIRISQVARYTGNFSPATSFVVDSDTVTYWKFNEGSGTTARDATGNHNGILQGSPPPVWVNGR